MTPPLVIVVAYGRDDDVREALDALGIGLRAVVVDNGDSDVARATAERAGASYVRAGRNVGFAAGVNLGLDGSWNRTEDVLLLNPDARIDRAGVAALQTTLHATPRCAAVGPRLVGSDGAEQAADWPMPSPAQVWMDALGLGRWWRGRRFVTGAVLLLNGAALLELGGLDERYFLYAEEADWQQRAQRAGWTVRIATEVTAHHVGGASSSDPTVREDHFHRSAATFGRKWHGRVGWQAMRAGSIVAAARRTVTGSATARAEARRTLRRYVHSERGAR